MMNNNVKNLIQSLLIAVLVSSAFYYITYTQQKKIVVVDAVKLFNGFNMKKELEGQADAKLIVYKRQLDSLEKLLKLTKYAKDSVGNKRVFGVYMMAKREMEGQYAQSNQLINEMVWKRLNPLIDEFGKKKAYHLIIGANGMGSVLYNDAYYDKTDEMIQYANKNYENEN